MRKEKKAALDVLARSAEVHNCWTILDEVVTCDERDRFTREYIKGEREMLADAIIEEIYALRRLGKCYGINVEVSCSTIKKWEA